MMWEPVIGSKLVCPLLPTIRRLSNTPQDEDVEILSKGEDVLSRRLAIQKQIQLYAVKNKTTLYSEAKRAKKLWGDESDKFICDLIETGSVDKAREGSKGIPLPKPKKPPAKERQSSSLDEVNDESPSILDWKEFIICAAECSREQPETKYTIFLFQPNDRTLRDFSITFTPSSSDADLKAEMGQLPFSPDQIDRIVITWEGRDFKATSFLKHELTKANLDVFFEKTKQDLPLLKRCLDSLLTPFDMDDTIVKPNLKYVATDPKDASSLFPPENQQTDKGYAIVVAGESGSGKSVFSIKQAQDNAYQPLYLTITSKHLEGKPPFDSFALNKLLDLTVSQVAENESESEALFALKNVLNVKRNDWAQGVLADVIKNLSFSSTLHKDEVRTSQEQFQTWIRGKWLKANRPEKVAIIVDEGTDVDLAEGLISQVRSIMKCYSGLAQKQVLLIIAGVGLDAIKEDGRVGTNPAYSTLVLMNSPKIEQVIEHEQVDKAVLEALNKGKYAQVLKTNSRMFFRSVLPILRSDYHKVDANFDPVTKTARYADRLLDIASFRPVMDHAVRFYVKQNSVKRLANLTLSNLLLQAFASHLVEAMKKCEDRGTQAVQKNTEKEISRVCEFEVYKEIQDNPTKNIFALGLASKSNTSNALKFMACFGLTCELRPQFGDEFEELTALHFMRYMEAQGYLSRRHVLKHAWPPKGSEACLEKALQNQEKNELLDLEFNVPASQKLCLVFSQGTPTAQGGDVLALLVDFQEGRAELETIQCKHYQTMPPRSECCKWWESLGVALGTDGSAILDPQDGSAGKSYRGLQAFRDLLTKRLNQSNRSLEVSIGKRTLAVSLKTPASAEFPIPEDESCRVWFREMFEPTLSAMSVTLESATND